MGQWAQTVHMFPTHITSQLGNAHSSQPLILLFFPVGFVREMSLPAPDLRKGSAPCVPDGLSSRLGFDQGKEAAGGWLLPQNVAVEAFGSLEVFVRVSSRQLCSRLPPPTGFCPGGHTRDQLHPKSAAGPQLESWLHSRREIMIHSQAIPSPV